MIESSTDLLRKAESVDVDVAAAGTGLLEQAIQAAGRGDRGAARSLLLHASEVAPAHDLVWLWLAQISSSPTDKAKYLRHVLKLHPGHEVARTGLADALREEGVAAAKAGSKGRARSLLQGSIELDRNHEESWLWLSAVAESEDERRAHLMRVLEIDPGHRQARTLLELLSRRSASDGGVGFDAGEAALFPPIRGAKDEDASAGQAVGGFAPAELSHREVFDRAKAEGILDRLADLAGFVGACLVDGRCGFLLGSEGGSDALDFRAAAAGDIEVVRAQAGAMASLGSNDEVEDIVIALDRQCHLIRPLGAREGLFLHLTLDKHLANLALARLRLATVEHDLSV